MGSTRNTKTVKVAAAVLAAFLFLGTAAPAAQAAYLSLGGVRLLGSSVSVVVVNPTAQPMRVQVTVKAILSDGTVEMRSNDVVVDAGGSATVNVGFSKTALGVIDCGVIVDQGTPF